MRHVTPEELTRIGEDLAREQRERELERERERLEDELAARLEYERLDPLYVRRDAEAAVRTCLDCAGALAGSGVCPFCGFDRGTFTGAPSSAPLDRPRS